MNTDEDMLDWGGNEDEDGQKEAPDSAGIAFVPRQKDVATKDAATLSGANSLLALAFGGTSKDAHDDKDDKDSDVVSLGGGEDDMEELHAYQSRTHLSGTTSGDTNSSAQSAPSVLTNAGDGSQEPKRQKPPPPPPPPPPPASTSQVIAQNSKPTPNELASDARRLLSKPNDQAKSQSSDHTRSPSTTRLLPPTGSLALPPKPVAAPTTPYVRPSHPSIMSASSMAAPPRDRERDPQRESVKGKSGAHGYTSPDIDALPLAPGWEVRRARDGTQDTYYYNTKTQQSTWSRSLATGTATSNLEGSQSPTYMRGRAKEHAQFLGRESTAGRDTPHTTGTEQGPLSRSRQSRFEPVKGEFGERQYRPSERSAPRSPPQGSGDLHLQRLNHAGVGPHMTRREPSPTDLRAPPHKRDNDRSAFVSRRDQDLDRGPNDRAQPHMNGRVPRRNGETNMDRERSRSPGRGRSSQIAWRNDPMSNHPGGDAPGSPPRDRRALATVEGTRPYSVSSPPLYRGPPQPNWSSSSGHEDRSRYSLPNHAQSSARTLSTHTPSSLHSTSSPTEVKPRVGVRKTPPRPSLEDSVTSSLDLFSCYSNQPKDAHHGPLLFSFLSLLRPFYYYASSTCKILINVPPFPFPFMSLFLLFPFSRRQTNIAAFRSTWQAYAFQVTRLHHQQASRV